MKIKLLYVVLAISLPLSIVSAKNQFDDQEVRAALSLLEAKNELEYNYRFCRAMAEDYSYKYDYINYIWNLKNRSYLQISENILTTLPISSSNDIKQRWKHNEDVLLSARSSASNNENGKYCTQYFLQMATRSTPKVNASRSSLAPRLGSTEEIRILERNNNMEVGCVKSAYNRDVKQFEEIRKACDCQTSLILNKLSNQEVDQYITLIAGSNAQNAAAFVEKGIAVSDLQACYSKVGSH